MHIENGRDIQVGDIVTLKSGGPPMTVTGGSFREKVECTFFMNDTLYTGCFFPIDALLVSPRNLRQIHPTTSGDWQAAAS